MSRTAVVLLAGVIGVLSVAVASAEASPEAAGIRSVVVPAIITQGQPVLLEMLPYVGALDPTTQHVAFLYFKGTMVQANWAVQGFEDLAIGAAPGGTLKAIPGAADLATTKKAWTPDASMAPGDYVIYGALVDSPAGARQPISSTDVHFLGVHVVVKAP